MSKMLLNQINIGMILKENLYDNQKHLLASKGEAVDNSLLKMLKTLNIANIDVQSNGQVMSLEDRSRKIDNLSSVFRRFTLLKYSIYEKIRIEISSVISKIMLDDNALQYLEGLRSIDDYSYNHAIHTGLLSGFIAYLMKHDSQYIENAIFAGIYHSVGKLSVNKELLLKPTSYNQDEYAFVKEQLSSVDDYLDKLSFINPQIRMAIKQHQERCDGSGYPLGLKADEISDLAKIIAVANEYDAAVSHKCYNDAISPFNASEELASNSQSALDSKVSQTLISFLQKNYIGLRVALSSGESGKIIHNNNLYPNRPVVKISERKFYDLSKDNSLKITAVIPE